jgi:hypothetical protein
MSSLYLQMNDMKLHKEIMQESDNLELEIQQTIDSAQKMLVASPQVLEKDNPVDTESVLLTGGNDLSTESNNNLQTEVQTTIPPGTQTTTLPCQTPISQVLIPPGTQTTTLPYQTPSSQAPIPPGTQTTILPYQSTQTTTLSYQSPSYQSPIQPGTQTTTLPYPISPQMQGGNIQQLIVTLKLCAFLFLMVPRPNLKNFGACF